MVWYHQKKMTVGAVVLYFMLVSFVVVFFTYIPQDAGINKEVSNELILLSLTYISVLYVLYLSLMPTGRKWGVALVATLLMASAVLLLHCYAPVSQPGESPQLYTEDA